MCPTTVRPPTQLWLDLTDARLVVMVAPAPQTWKGPRQWLASTPTRMHPHAKLTRSQEGVLEVVLHTNGGTLIFNGYAHEEFVELFHQIGQDAGNRVIILTGAGEAFIDRIDPEGFDFFSPRGYDKIYREGKKVLSNLLDIPVPVIAALNGATTVHSEYALLADIVIATPDTVFQDKPHFAFGIVPGDGGHRLDPRSHIHAADDRRRGGKNAGRDQRDRYA
jgi:enoyl-CoA hydratase/carnithine racemase